MSSYIFAHQIGFFMLGALAFSISLILLIVVIVLWRKTSALQDQLTTFCQGNDGAKLEDTLLTLAGDVKTLDSDIQELFTISNQIHALSNRGLHKIAMIRFNPFKDLGGNQSFSIAFLDGKNDGIVISSLHTREGTRVYSKNIREGDSTEHELTEEEHTVIAEAIEKHVTVATE